MNGVSENVNLLSMRSDILFTDESEYKENHIAVANTRDLYEYENYPKGVWIVRLETDRAPSTIPIVSGKPRNNTPRWNMGRFKSKEAARRFIRSRVEPQEVKKRFYPQICNCLSWAYQLEYAQCEGIVFERCSNCLMPTKHIFREPLNAAAVVGFNLDDFGL